MKSPKSAINLPLKVAIIESRTKQRDLAQRLAIGEVRLSQIVNGRLVPTPEERRALARVLKRPQAVLFDDDGGEDSHVA